LSGKTENLLPNCDRVSVTWLFLAYLAAKNLH